MRDDARLNLVAGGAGFIGSNLCRSLLEAGEAVICLDNLITGKRANILDLLGWPRFSFLEADVVDELPLLPRTDRVYHLASPASPPAYSRYAIETLRTNSEGTRRLLELAGGHGARFLYASTSEVYGDPLEHPQREDYRGNVSTTGERSMYDEGKRFGEALTAAFTRSGAVDARIVRIFNTYGPASDPLDGRMVPNFITQALAGAPITVFGDGSQTRSLCYVDDIVDGLRRAMESPSAVGQVINLGNPDERTVLDCAWLIRRLCNSSSSLVFRSHPVGDDPNRRRPEIAKAVSLLGWTPKVSPEEGLPRTIEYFREAMARQASRTGREAEMVQR